MNNLFREMKQATFRPQISGKERTVIGVEFWTSLPVPASSRDKLRIVLLHRSKKRVPRWRTRRHASPATVPTAASAKNLLPHPRTSPAALQDRLYCSVRVPDGALGSGHKQECVPTGQRPRLCGSD